MQINKDGLSIILKGRKKDYSERIAWAERKVDALVYCPLNSNQYSALVSLIIDEPRINAGYRIIRMLNDGLYFRVADEFLRFKGVRRKHEHQLFKRPCLVVSNRGGG